MTPDEQSQRDRARHQVRAAIDWKDDKPEPGTPRIVWTSSGVSGRYANAFHLAGDLIAREMEGAGPLPANRINDLLTPLLYNYRHSLELALKNVCLQIEKLLALREDRVLPDIEQYVDIKHSLVVVWRKLLGLMDEVDPQATLPPLVGRFIEAMNQVDSTSTGTRYEKDEHRPPPDRTAVIDVPKLRELMEEVHREIFGLAHYVEALIQEAQDAWSSI